MLDPTTRCKGAMMEIAETPPDRARMHTLLYHVDQPTSSISYEGKAGREEVHVADPWWSLTLEVPRGFFAFLRAQKSHGDDAVLTCVIALDDQRWQASRANHPYAVVECSGIVDVPD